MNDERSEFGKAAAAVAKDRWLQLSPEQRKEVVNRMVEAAKRRYAALTPEQKKEEQRKRHEGRVAALALKRLRGERTDQMSPETRKRVARMGGLAFAAKYATKFKNLPPAERKVLAASAVSLVVARAARAAKLEA